MGTVHVDVLWPVVGEQCGDFEQRREDVSAVPPR
jgi:hypothetical protein